MNNNLYNQPDLEDDEVMDWFQRHLSAMTTEKLFQKSDIAWQLAIRDAEIDKLRKAISQTNKTL